MKGVDGLMGGDRSEFIDGSKISAALTGIVVKESTKQKKRDLFTEEYTAIHSKKIKESLLKVDKDKQSKNMSFTRNSDEYKQRHFKTCEHCNKITDPGNYNRWHGDKCKHNGED